MSFKEIKKAIHEKYPGRYTDEEIENLPIIIGNDYEYQSTDVENSMISIIDNGFYMGYNFEKRILVIEAY